MPSNYVNVRNNLAAKIHKDSIRLKTYATDVNGCIGSLICDNNVNGLLRTLLLRV